MEKSKLIKKKTKIWYSKKYLINQLLLAYQAGIAKGVQIEFHAVTPFNNENVDTLVEKFKEIVNTEYTKDLENIKIQLKNNLQ